MKLWRNSYIFGYFVIDSKKKKKLTLMDVSPITARQEQKLSTLGSLKDSFFENGKP